MREALSLRNLMILPLFFGVNGIWLATPVAELMALALSVFMFLKYRKRYGFYPAFHGS